MAALGLTAVAVVRAALRQAARHARRPSVDSRPRGARFQTPPAAWPLPFTRDVSIFLRLLHLRSVSQRHDLALYLRLAYLFARAGLWARIVGAALAWRRGNLPPPEVQSGRARQAPPIQVQQRDHRERAAHRAAFIRERRAGSGQEPRGWLLSGRFATAAAAFVLLAWIPSLVPGTVAVFTHVADNDANAFTTAQEWAPTSLTVSSDLKVGQMPS
ncbi:MAG: hypothetical protein CL878_11630 [Dehalococcoidia bacterium]|nr:hypothetical protein [Dehalococcoidia bacterium]